VLERVRKRKKKTRAVRKKNEVVIMVNLVSVD